MTTRQKQSHSLPTDGQVKVTQQVFQTREERIATVIHRIKTDEKYAKAFFERVGFLDKNGQITELYR